MIKRLNKFMMDFVKKQNTDNYCNLFRIPNQNNIESYFIKSCADENRPGLFAMIYRRIRFIN